MNKTKIIFLVLPHVHLLDLAGPDQVFHEAKELGANLAIEYCSIDDSVSTSSRLSINQLKLFSRVKINKGDYVFVPGAETKLLTVKAYPMEAELKKWLTEGYRAGAIICSVCTGSFFLARLGLLNGLKCTTHWKKTAELKARYPAVNLVEDILFTESDRIFTSAGVTSGIDMALFIVGRMVDDSFSFKVARELVVYIRRQGYELQRTIFMNYRNHIHSGVHRVQDYLQENISIKHTLEQLAQLACMSARNLTRIFRKETGITINQYISLIRKEYLGQLINNPDITRKQMASLCGLKSERQIIRLLSSR